MHQVAGHVAGRGAAAEDLVHAKVMRRVRVEPRPAHHQQRPLGAEPGSERRRHLARVGQVGVALRHDLADQDGVGMLGRGTTPREVASYLAYTLAPEPQGNAA